MRIDQTDFDFARMGDGIEDGVFGDSWNTTRCGLMFFRPRLGFEDFQKMPRNGFAFPIRVGCEVDVFGFFGTGDDGIDVFAVAADQLVFHGKAIVGIDCSAFRNQIADVAVRRQDFKSPPRYFFRVLAWTGIRRLIGFSPLLFSFGCIGFMFQTVLYY